MEKFNVPIRFKDILDQNTALSGLVDTSLSEFGSWLERNNVKFFTEYTDHSLKHIEEVLKEADELIREQCRGIITPADVATLTIATLLHDCAMHIGTDSFIDLVQSDNRPLIQGFGDKPWKMLWLDFLAEARRFSGRKLMALFGDTEAVEYPSMKSQQMTGRDLLLIGEFLRRHHHRLAHEIALFGVPGSTKDKLKLPSTDDTKYIIDLAGVVARSHGMSIRDCTNYLKDNFSSEKIYKGVHTIFIMTLLRIADILQIQSSRAPKQVEKILKLQSPVSLGEWEMHQSIEFINKNHDDPETIMVVAQPTTARTYLRIRRMLDQIQSELDSSWTIIGETYSYNPQFRELGLRYRRIKSNIDDLDTFSKQVQYVPTQASFEVADSDILKLLIGPLYGNRPEIGIRELLQNSLDAVRELREYQKQNPEFKDTDLTQQDGDVVISIEQDDQGRWWVKVSDRGIGMTIETVKDYFLKAGASLRRNELWRKTFEDVEGRSKVLRSGRFGIGALATFLLGDEIYLSTRYVKNMPKEGIEFRSLLDAESIELRQIERPVGTTIYISLTEETKDILLKFKEHGYGKDNYSSQGDDWDWYVLDDPKVTRYISGETLQQKYKLPPANSDLPTGWNRISYSGYDDIQWTYIYNSKHESPSSLTCNGIPIEDKFRSELLNLNLEFRDFIDGQLNFAKPSISVFDSDANLPLNLQRTELTIDKFPFNTELQESVIKDFIAYLLVNIPTQPLYQNSDNSFYKSINYHGISNQFIGENPFSPWFSTKTGIGLINIDNHILQTKAKSALILFDYASQSKYISKDLEEKWLKGFEKTSLLFKYYSNEDSRHSIARETRMSKAIMFGKSLEFAFTYGKTVHYRNPPTFIKAGRRILINRKVIKILEPLNEVTNKILTLIPKINTQEILDLVEWENKDWLLLKLGECPKAKFDFSNFASQKQFSNTDEWPCILTELYFSNDQKAEVGSPMLEQIWNELLQSPIIPYDIKERKKLFARAYKELDPFIKSHEEMKKEIDL